MMLRMIFVKKLKNIEDLDTFIDAVSAVVDNKALLHKYHTTISVSFLVCWFALTT